MEGKKEGGKESRKEGVWEGERKEEGRNNFDLMSPAQLTENTITNMGT